MGYVSSLGGKTKSLPVNHLESFDEISMQLSWFSCQAAVPEILAKLDSAFFRLDLSRRYSMRSMTRMKDLCTTAHVKKPLEYLQYMRDHVLYIYMYDIDDLNIDISKHLHITYPCHAIPSAWRHPFVAFWFMIRLPGVKSKTLGRKSNPQNILAK